MPNINLKYNPRKWQAQCHADRSRFRVIALHRRGGKSTFATMELIDAALKTTKELALFIFVAPFLSQAKSIAWGMIKQRLAELLKLEAIHINEAELTITFLHNGAKLKLYGADNPDAMRGVRLDGCVMDEVAQMKPEVWDDIIQPALSDRKGWAIFIGCVVSSTRILTTDGIKRIGNLSKNKPDKTLDKIDLDLYGIDKAWHKANGFFYNGKVETIKATTSKGFSIEASHPHPILICDKDGSYVWKRMRDISIGDKACIDYGMEIWGNKDPLDGFSFHNDDRRGYKARRHKVDLPVKMDENFAYLMGLWLAEGSIEHKTYRVTITCGDSEDVAAQIEKYGFRKCRKDQWRCNSHVLVEMMKYIGMPLTTAPNKFLPDWVWNGKRKWASAFVSGYLDGDGWVRSGTLNCAGKKNNGIRRELGFASSSKQLLQDLQVLLTNVGAVGKLRQSITKPTKRVKVSSVLNQLNFGGQDFDALKNFLKLRIKRKAILIENAVRVRKIVDVREKYVLDEIINLENGFSETFDFTVPETNSFWTNGFISHNTPSGINMFSEKYFKAKTLPDWNSHLFTVYDTDAIDKEEVERLKRDMAEFSFQREYLCNFSAAGNDQLIGIGEVDAASRKIYKDGENSYAPRIIGVDPARYGDDCFDDITEILTNDGWKLFSELNGKEKVLSIGANEKKATWGEIEKIHQYDFDGEMNLVQNKSLNFCVTDKHRLLVRKNPKSKKYKFEAFKDLPKEFIIREQNGWCGKSPKYISLKMKTKQPHGGYRTIGHKFNFMDWAEFLGWFVSEGNVYVEKRHQGRLRIMIAQNPGKKQDLIRDLLTRMGIKFRITPNNKQFEFSSRPVGEWLIKHCCSGAENKRVPKCIKDGSEEVIEKFLNSFLLGDGTCKKNGKGRSYITSSKLLADDLQEMLAKLGRAGSLKLKEKKSSVFYINDRKVMRENDTYVLYERRFWHGKTVLKRDVERVQYKGKIWCVSTPLQSIYVRRNGTPMWSGNSSVIMKRQGFLMYEPISFHGLGNMELADQLVYHINQWQPDAVFIDAGNGSGVIDRVRQLGHNVIEVPFGGKSTDPKYANKRAQMWGEMRDWLKEGGSIPNHSRLKQDLATPRYWFDKNGKLILEPKDDIKARGLPSTDYGDAACLTFAAPVGIKNRNAVLQKVSHEVDYNPLGLEAARGN